MDGSGTSGKTTRHWRQAAGIGLAACAMLAAPAAASAQEPLEIDRAREVARAYWNAEPCGGQVDVRWTGMAEDTNATSSWTNPFSAYDNPEHNGNCVIDFNTRQAWDWERLCTVVVHEYGHLLGRPHVEDPADVMFEYYERPVEPCLQPKAVVATAAAAVPAPVAAKRRPKPRRHRRGALVLVRRAR